MLKTCFVCVFTRTLPFFLLLWAGPCFAQEISLDVLPPQMRKPMPDQVIYHMFLRHLAAFERLAQQAQANGQNPDPWRKHILHKFGLTADEQQKIMPIALQYDAQWRSIHEQEEIAIKTYKDLYFPKGTWPKGQPLPPKSDELLSLQKSSQDLALRAKEQVTASLGATRFAGLDSMIRSHLGLQAFAAHLAQENAQMKGAAK